MKNTHTNREGKRTRAFLQQVFMICEENFQKPFSSRTNRFSETEPRGGGEIHLLAHASTRDVLRTKSKTQKKRIFTPMTYVRGVPSFPSFHFVRKGKSSQLSTAEALRRRIIEGFTSVFVLHFVSSHGVKDCILQQVVFSLCVRRAKKILPLF